MDRKLIILDIDGTLLHCFEYDIDYLPCIHYDFEIYFDNKIFGYVYERPNVKEFIKYLFNYYDVAVWTAAGSEYADQIVKKLFTDEQRKELKFVWSSEKCINVSKQDGLTTIYNYTVKPLKKIWRQKSNNYNKFNVYIIDDTPLTYSRNIRNAIPIKKFVPINGCHICHENNDDSFEIIKTKLEYDRLNIKKLD